MSGSRTPAYADGGRTVNPYSDGNRTAYGGTSGSGGVRLLMIFIHSAKIFVKKHAHFKFSTQRTPAWDPGARTSYGGDPFGGSKTPAYTADSRTPAYNSASSTAYAEPWTSSANATGSNTAGNSRPYDAPTPGRDMHVVSTPSNVYAASTPAAAAPTPKFSGYAADAPTPFSGQPETPAPWGGDDGPRYEEGTPSP